MPVEDKLVQALELPQVVLVLTVRKVGLQTLSIKESVKLVEEFSIMTQSITMNKDYSVNLRMMLDGVMTSTNA